MFRKALGISAVCLSLITGFTGQAFSEEETCPYSLTASTAINSDYMWRGFRLYRGVSVQPSINGTYDTGDYGKLGGNIWSHISAEQEPKDEKFTEIDYTINYSYDVSMLTLSVGNVWYTYPTDNTHSIKKSAEVYASVTTNEEAGLPIIPVFSVYHDYQAVDWVYYELGFSYPYENSALGEGFNMTPYITFGFASNAEKAYDKNGFEQMTFGTSFNLKLGVIDVIPSVNYTKAFDDAAQSNFWAGTTFSYTF